MTETEVTSTALSPEEHARYRDPIIDRAMQRSPEVTGEPPVAVILAGQPGAGKTRLRQHALADLRKTGRPIVVDVDDLRAKHPNYLELSNADDLTAADKTQRDASLCADALRDAGITGRRNLIIDGTLKNPEQAEALCNSLREAGYRVEVRALAVAPEDSRLGIYLRYEEAHAKAGTGRWVPEPVHDQALAGMPESLRYIEGRGLADRVQVYRRGSERPVYDNPAARDGRTEGAANVIQAEHRHAPTLDELRDRVDGWRQWHDLATINGHLNKPYAQRGLDLEAQAQQTRIRALDAQYEAAKANGRLASPETQPLLAERAKAHREHPTALDETVPDRTLKGKGVGKDGSERRQPDRDDR